MSFKKYIEYKKDLKTIISIENYKNQLNEDLLSLLNKPNIIKFEELKNNLVDEFKLSKLLYEIEYPHAEKLKIIVKSNNSKKIAEERASICEWGKLYEKDVSKIVNLLLFYESFFYSNKISIKDLNNLVESYSNQIMTKLLDLASKINDAKDKIKWHNYPIVLEAIYPEKGFLSQEALLKIGDDFNKKFIVSLNSNQVKEIEDEKEIPVSLKEDGNNLINKIFEENYKNKIAILYMNRPKKERKKLENIQREIILGIKQSLPFNSILFENFHLLEGHDVWKVRTDLNKLKQSNDQYVVLSEDVPLKWIERVS